MAPVQSSPSPLTDEHEQELQQLRQNITLLTQQCTQLDEANRAWQLYQQTQLDTFKQTMHDFIPIDDTLSFEQAAQQITHQITKERQDFTQRYHTLEQLNHRQQSGNHSNTSSNLIVSFCIESTNDIETIKQSYINTIDELSQQLANIRENNQQTNGSYKSLRDVF